MRSVVLVVAALVRVTAVLVDPGDPADPVLRFESSYDGQAQWDIFQKQYSKSYAHYFLLKICNSCCKDWIRNLFVSANQNDHILSFKHCALGFREKYLKRDDICVLVK